MPTLLTNMEIEITPSRTLLRLIEQHGSVLAASEAWGIPNATLARFIANEGDLSQQTVAVLMKRTGCSYENLFHHKVRKR